MTVKMIVVGSVAYDSIGTPDGKRERALGGSAVYFSTVASFFTEVGLVGVAGRDFDAAHRAFLQLRGIDLSGFTQVEGETFHWAGSYGKDFGDATTHATRLNVFSAFDPELPPEYRQAPYVFLANIHPELQMKVIAQVQRPRLIALDTMNFWIEGAREALLKAIAKVDVLFLNRAEASMLAGEPTLTAAWRKLLELGPRRLVIKLGELGAMTVTRDHLFLAPAFPLPRVVDPTGAGDSFAGGLMGAVARGDDLSEAAFRKAMLYGSTMGAFTCEDFSIDSYRRLSAQALEERFHKLAGMLRLEGGF